MIVFEEVEKAFNNKKVVDTGIRKRVSISNITGAAKCRKLNVAGASENPLDCNRW